MATIESLSDEVFENGRTLCAEWAPRDVLGHLLGTSDIALYVPHGMIVRTANAEAVARSRELARPELTSRGGRGHSDRHWRIG